MEEKKQCACGCGKVLRRDNSTGWFTGHKPTDGVGRGNGRKASGEAGSERVPPRKPVSKPNRKVQRTAAKPNGDGVATICVPESALDQFWASRNLDEKAHLFTEFLTGAK